MGKLYEDDLMEIQSDLISLCMEVSEGNVDKIYAYASIEEKSSMFNAFFKRDNQVLTLAQLGIEPRLRMEFLKVGTGDLNRIRDLGSRYEHNIPTEIKMIYDVKSKQFDAQYKYDVVCSIETGKAAGEIFAEWLDDEKNN